MKNNEEPTTTCYEVNHCLPEVQTDKMDCENCEQKQKQKEKEVYNNLLGC